MRRDDTGAPLSHNERCRLSTQPRITPTTKRPAVGSPRSHNQRSGFAADVECLRSELNRPECSSPLKTPPRLTPAAKRLDCRSPRSRSGLNRPAFPDRTGKLIAREVRREA